MAFIILRPNNGGCFYPVRESKNNNPKDKQKSQHFIPLNIYVVMHITIAYISESVNRVSQIFMNNREVFKIFNRISQGDCTILKVPYSTIARNTQEATNCTC